MLSLQVRAQANNISGRVVHNEFNAGKIDPKLPNVNLIISKVENQLNWDSGGGQGYGSLDPPLPK